MNIWQRLYLIWRHIIEVLCITNKIPKPKELEPIKRKGNVLANPSPTQYAASMGVKLQLLKLNQLTIVKNYYESNWPKRPIGAIDTIIVEASGSKERTTTWHSVDTAPNNTVSREALPGISMHLFIHNTGVVENCAAYTDLITHTPGKNMRAINLMLDFNFREKNSSLSVRMYDRLIKTLTILCLEFGLNPNKAIKGWSEVTKFTHYFKWLKGRQYASFKESPGKLIDMDRVRQDTIINLKKVLTYGKLYTGTWNKHVDKEFIKALHKAQQSRYGQAVRHVYDDAEIRSTKTKDKTITGDSW